MSLHASKILSNIILIKVEYAHCFKKTQTIWYYRTQKENAHPPPLSLPLYNIYINTTPEENPLFLV